jgi:ElaA protein
VSDGAPSPAGAELTGPHWARGPDLDAATLYELLRLRVEVFVAEQRSPYADLDGLDLLPTTEHGWMSVGGEIVACVRLLEGPDAVRVGRVATAPAHRGRGLAATLLEEALARTTGPVVLDAQSYLTTWYGRYGFVVTGPAYLDEGVPHVPMRLDR